MLNIYRRNYSVIKQFLYPFLRRTFRTLPIVELKTELEDYFIMISWTSEKDQGLMIVCPTDLNISLMCRCWSLSPPLHVTECKDRQELLVVYFQRAVLVQYKKKVLQHQSMIKSLRLYSFYQLSTNDIQQFCMQFFLRL